MELRVKVFQAWFPANDPGGLINPYVRLQIGGRAFTTTVATASSIWNQEFLFAVEEDSPDLLVSVHDDKAEISFLGEVSIPVAGVFRSKDHSLGTSSFFLKRGDKFTPTPKLGRIELKICLGDSFNPSRGLEIEDSTFERAGIFSGGILDSLKHFANLLYRIGRFLRSRLSREERDQYSKERGSGWWLTVVLLEASKLAHVDPGALPDPCVRLKCNGNTKTSSVLYQDSNPCWNETFYFGSMDEAPSTLNIEVLDFEGPFEGFCIGEVELHLLRADVEALRDVWIPLFGELAESAKSKLHFQIYLDHSAGAKSVKPLSHYHLEHEDMPPAMEEIYSSTHDLIPAGSIMDLFKGGDMEHRLMEAVGCKHYRSSPWDNSQQRQVSYRFDETVSRFGGGVMSTQKRCCQRKEHRWLIKEIINLQGTPFCEFFTVHLSYLIEGRKKGGSHVRLHFGILWKKSTLHKTRMTKNLLEGFKKRTGLLLQEIGLETLQKSR